MAIKVKVRKWRDSMRVIFPKKFIKEQQLKENDSIIIEIVKIN